MNWWDWMRHKFTFNANVYEFIFIHFSWVWNMYGNSTCKTKCIYIIFPIKIRKWSHGLWSYFYQIPFQVNTHLPSSWPCSFHWSRNVVGLDEGGCKGIEWEESVRHCSSPQHCLKCSASLLELTVLSTFLSTWTNSIYPLKAYSSHLLSLTHL